MREKKNGVFSLFKGVVLVLVSAPLILFLITATVCSLFGYSLWSWINALRFIIGGGIALAVTCYYFIIKSMLKAGTKK